MADFDIPALVDELREHCHHGCRVVNGQQCRTCRAAAALSRLTRALAERDAELAEMRALFCAIREIHEVPGRADAIVDGEGVAWFAKLVSQFFYAAGGKNYVEWQASVGTAEFVLTCQRKAGKTPDELRREAERERDEARAALARYEADHAKRRP